MKNPWFNLTAKPPFVLDEDRSFLDSFNSRHRGSVKEIILDEMPSPYIGNPEASVIFLNLNPGYVAGESASPIISRFREMAKANLLHQFFDYPFYPLDPTLEGTPSGYRWFTQKFNPLIIASGMSSRALSQKIFLVEYFPYRSQKYGWDSNFLLSQEYSIDLVKKAISRQAIVVIMRGEALWLSALPILREYSNRCTLHSPQNVTISENNLGEEGFRAIMNKLRG